MADAAVAPGRPAPAAVLGVELPAAVGVAVCQVPPLLSATALSVDAEVPVVTAVGVVVVLSVPATPILSEVEFRQYLDEVVGYVQGAATADGHDGRREDGDAVRFPLPVRLERVTVGRDALSVVYAPAAVVFEPSVDPADAHATRTRAACLPRVAVPDLLVLPGTLFLLGLDALVGVPPEVVVVGVEERPDVVVEVAPVAGTCDDVVGPYVVVAPVAVVVDVGVRERERLVADVLFLHRLFDKLEVEEVPVHSPV